jgi:hypothetical protein
MASFIDNISNPLKQKIFFLTNLPMALLAGLVILHIDATSAKVGLKYSYLTKNPFKSLYFACLAMAAELCSGVLVLNEVDISKAKISTLVTEMEAKFLKKAVGKIVFSCLDAEMISEKIKETIATKSGVTVKTKSIGTDEHGDIVAEFYITWSMKAK